MNEKLFPYKCKEISEEYWFTPTMIDYMNQQVWHQRSQVSEDGEWIDFDDVEFIKNPEFVDLTEIKR